MQTSLDHDTPSMKKKTNLPQGLMIKVSQTLCPQGPFWMAAPQMCPALSQQDTHRQPAAVSIAVTQEHSILTCYCIQGDYRQSWTANSTEQYRILNIFPPKEMIAVRGDRYVYADLNTRCITFKRSGGTPLTCPALQLVSGQHASVQ